LIALCVFIITMLIKRTVSFSSVSGALVLLAVSWIFPLQLYQKIIMTAIVLIVILKHKDNIVRLLHGTEPVTTFKKKV
jgi:glycerol-3-phosphate acyltransferase PlsY